MSEELNGLLTSQLHNSSTDQLHQSLRLLVRKIRAQLEVLTKKNKLKEEENALLNNEIDSLKQQIINLETIINAKVATENKLNDDIKSFESEIEKQTQRHSAIESQLLNQLSSIRKEKQEIIRKHESEINEMNKNHDDKLKEEKQNFDNLRNQKLSLDTKLQEIMKNNDLLYAKLQELQQKQQDLSSMTNTEKNELEQKMEEIKTENINYLSTIQQLKNEINGKDKEINDIGMSLISKQNDINHLQSQKKANNNTVNQYQSKLKESQQQLIHFQNQYKKLQSTMDEIIKSSKQSEDDVFWPIDSIDNDTDNNDDEYILSSTTAHPFPCSLNSNDMDNHKRLLEIQMFPKRIIEIQKELKEYKNKFLIEKETSVQVATYWKNKTQEISTKNADLAQRMENLERMVDELSSHNDNLLKENDSIKAEMHNNKFTSSAHEIFLQMKSKEETEKTIELQQELDVLQDDLCRKTALISKLEKNNGITKESMEQQKKLHQTEMLELTNKLHLLTQLSQEEIQQTFHVTIKELQSILDQNINIKQDDIDIDIDNNKDIDSEHLLSPKLNTINSINSIKPHITDSDVGDDNDDIDIIEAEDKLASYFARHKQRQIDIGKNRNNSVETIQEVNDENNDKLLKIVDDEDVNDEDDDDNILTPPLQEEAPYIVDDTLSIDHDKGISNVSISNVANSACSTRGNSTNGDKDENKQDIKPQIVDDDDNKNNSENKGVEDVLNEFLNEEKSDNRLLHSLHTFLSNSTTNTNNTNNTNNILSPQPLQTRQRSMGSVLSTITNITTGGDDVMSIDQSMLAHDGSRDGSVVPEATNDIFHDETDEIITADISTTNNNNNNNNIYQVPVHEEYIATPDVADTEITDIKTLHSHSMDISVDDIHNEAHQIIDELQDNLKELQIIDDDNNDNNDNDNNQIINNDILAPLIQRQQNHDHHHNEDEIEKQKQILMNAKSKWTQKVEDMIANTDQWFINEDGDIVLIYPEETQIVNKENKENKDNQNNKEEKEKNIEIEINKKDIVDIGDITKKEEEEIINNNEQEKQQKNLNELNHSLNQNDININNNDHHNHNHNNNDDKTDENVKKTETFFNSFRIF